MKRIPFLYRMIRGAIGKRLVVKHYRGGRVVMTRYPDMTGIVPSEAQKACRRLFKKATRYAQKVYACPVLKEEKRRTLRRPRRLFQALMKEWFRLRREAEFNRQRRLNKWQKSWQLNRPAMEIVPRVQDIRNQQIVNIKCLATHAPPVRVVPYPVE